MSAANRSSLDDPSGAEPQAGPSTGRQGVDDGFRDEQISGPSLQTRSEGRDEDGDLKTSDRLGLKEYGVEVCRVPGRGRGLLAASRSFKPGMSGITDVTLMTSY